MDANSLALPQNVYKQIQKLPSFRRAERWIEIENRYFLFLIGRSIRTLFWFIIMIDPFQFFHGQSNNLPRKSHMDQE